MRAFSIVGAATFIILVLSANVLFAMQLGATTYECVFWVGVAVASAAWTAGGVSVVAEQINRGSRVRAGAAGVLLCLALCYDCMAAYGLARQEQAHRQAAHLAHTTQVGITERDIKAARLNLERLANVTMQEAEAAIASISVTAEQCKSVVGPNRLRRFQADRIRAACAARTEALGLKAAAEARQALESRLGALRADLSALQAQTPAPDPRAELLPPEWVAWAPVLLVTGGGLLCGFATGRPAPTRRQEIDDEPEQDETPPVEPPKAPELLETLPEPLQLTADRLIRLAASKKAPDGLARDPAGYLRGAQRQLSAAVDQPLSRVNKALRFLSSAGVIDLDTGGHGTAYRLTSRNAAFAMQPA